MEMSDANPADIKCTETKKPSLYLRNGAIDCSRNNAMEEKF
jgi:hypothetical protein